MGPKPKDKKEEEETVTVSSNLAKVQITYTPESNNPNVTVKAVEIITDINTNCRMDILMDYTKKTFLKSLGTLIEEYSSLIGVEIMASEPKSSVESQIEEDAKDDSPDSKRKVKLDTLDSLNKTTMKKLKDFQALLQSNDLLNIVLEEQKSTEENEENEPKIVQVKSRKLMAENAGTLITPGVKYNLGIRRTETVLNEDAEENAENSTKEVDRYIFLYSTF